MYMGYVFQKSSPKMKWFQKFHQFHPHLVGLFVWLEVLRTAAKAAAAAFTMLGLPGSASGISSADSNTASETRIKKKTVQIKYLMINGCRTKENVVLKIMNNESLIWIKMDVLLDISGPSDKQYFFKQ